MPPPSGDEKIVQETLPSGSDDKPPLERRYLRIVLSALLCLVALVGFVEFFSAVNRHVPVSESIEYFIPTLVVFGLLVLMDFVNLMLGHDLQTWLFVLMTVFAFFLLTEAIIEKDQTRAGYWFAAFTGVLGFACGIPIGRLGGFK